MSVLSLSLESVLTLAARFDYSWIIVLIVAAFSFIRWIISQANQAKVAPPPQPRAPQQRPAQPQLAREIEMFLQEVGGQKKPAQKAQAVEIEVVGDDELRRRRSRKAPIPAQQAKRAEQRLPRKSERPGVEIETRARPGSKELGTKLQDHLQKYMQADRVEKEVEKHLSHQVNQGVQRHLGSFAAERSVSAPPAPADVPMPPTMFRTLITRLRDPQGMRDAILINEILTRRTVGRYHI